MNSNAKPDLDREEESDTAAARELSTTRELLSGLARVICDGVKLAEGSAKKAVEAARSVGKNLILAKQKVAHGEWDAWMRENTPLSARTAQAYMRLASQMEKLSPSKAQRVADLPLREAIKAIGSTAEDGSPSARDVEVVENVIDERSGTDIHHVAALRKTSTMLETFVAQLEAGAKIGAPIVRKLVSSLERSLKVVRHHQAALEHQQTDDPK